MTFNPLAHSITRDSEECSLDRDLIGTVFTSNFKYVFVVLHERTVNNPKFPEESKFYEILEIRQFKPGDPLILIDVFEANLTAWRLEDEFDYEQQEFYRKVKLFCFLYNNEKICFISKENDEKLSEYFDILESEIENG